MPATYAHFRFGREVLRRLSPETREAIAPRIQLYHIGLHGPDIFFYYHPLSKNPVQALGGQLHLLSGREIFTRMEAVRDRYPADSRRGLDAYIFGFICHYALDSSAHGTVYKGIKETGASHTAIESDFDRALLLEDGFEPAGQPPRRTHRPLGRERRRHQPVFPHYHRERGGKVPFVDAVFPQPPVGAGEREAGTAGAGAVGRPGKRNQSAG